MQYSADDDLRLGILTANGGHVPTPSFRHISEIGSVLLAHAPRLQQRAPHDKPTSNMGVNLFLLDRRTARLSVGGVVQDVSTLRRYYKLTELDLDPARDEEIERSAEAVSDLPSPKVAMNPDISDIPTADGREVTAHLVLAWEPGRTQVADFYWDYLKQIGYAVRNDAGDWELMEYVDGTLFPMPLERAVDLGLTDADGHLLQQEPTVIAECLGVSEIFTGYARADCILSTGARQELMVAVTGDRLPPPGWFVGKRPGSLPPYGGVV